MSSFLWPFLFFVEITKRLPFMGSLNSVDAFKFDERVSNVLGCPGGTTDEIELNFSL